MASAPRLAFDLAADLSELDHASVVEQILSASLCTMATLGRDRRVDWCHPGRPGSMLFVKTLVDASRPVVRSSRIPRFVLAKALQDARRAGRAAGRRSATAQRLRDPHRPRCASRSAGRSRSMSIRDHFLLEGTTRDKRRDRQCHLIGWQVERVTRDRSRSISTACATNSSTSTELAAGPPRDRSTRVSNDHPGGRSTLGLP